MPRTKKKVKSIVKTKVISARVTEVVHELLHRQAEDAGMTLSEFAAQMLMKGRVNTSYTPLSVGLYEKYLTGKGPCMAASFRDKGSGKSGLHGNHGV